jgi:hypothetical protein
MSDDLSKRGGSDRNKISLDQEHEVSYWTKELGVSKEELAEAVKNVGNNAERVREHLREGSRK